VGSARLGGTAIDTKLRRIPGEVVGSARAGYGMTSVTGSQVENS
jgi:hypothetical protein